MKLQKPVIVLLFFLSVNSVVWAKNNDKNTELERVINIYSDAVVHGRVEGLKEIIDESAQFRMLVGLEVKSYSKNERVKYFFDVQGVDCDCPGSRETISQSAISAVVKIDINYKDFIHRDFITMVKVKDQWKIIDVYTILCEH